MCFCIGFVIYRVGEICEVGSRNGAALAQMLGDVDISPLEGAGALGGVDE